MISDSAHLRAHTDTYRAQNDALETPDERHARHRLLRLTRARDNLRFLRRSPSAALSLHAAAEMLDTILSELIEEAIK